MGSGRIVDLVFSALVAKQPCVFYGAFSRIDDMRGERHIYRRCKFGKTVFKRAFECLLLMLEASYIDAVANDSLSAILVRSRNGRSRPFGTGIERGRCTGDPIVAIVRIHEVRVFRNAVHCTRYLDLRDAVDEAGCVSAPDVPRQRIERGVPVDDAVDHAAVCGACLHAGICAHLVVGDRAVEKRCRSFKVNHEGSVVVAFPCIARE